VGWQEDLVVTVVNYVEVILLKRFVFEIENVIGFMWEVVKSLKRTIDLLFHGNVYITLCFR